MMSIRPGYDASERAESFPAPQEEARMFDRLLDFGRNLPKQ